MVITNRYYFMQSHLMDIQQHIPSDVHSHNQAITSIVFLGAYPSWDSKFTARCHLTKYHIHSISFPSPIPPITFIFTFTFSYNSSHPNITEIAKSCCIPFPFSACQSLLTIQMELHDDFLRFVCLLIAIDMQHGFAYTILVFMRNMPCLFHMG